MNDSSVVKRILVFALWFALGIGVGVTISTNSNPQSVQVSNPQLVIKADYPNPAVVEFILAKPIAPDFFVQDDSPKRYERYLDEPEKWDPLGIGIDDALNLITRIRNEVPGVTDEISARGYDLRIIIAESHLSRKAEIIEEVTKIIQETSASSEIASAY